MKSEIGNRKGIVSETCRNDLEMEKVVGCKKRECGNVGSVNLKMDEVAMPLLFKEASKELRGPQARTARKAGPQGLRALWPRPRLCVSLTAQREFRGPAARTAWRHPRPWLSYSAMESAVMFSLIQRDAIVYKSCIDSETL